MRGFGLMEVLVGAAIVTTVAVGAASAIGHYIKVGLAQTQRVQAAYLLEEGLEAARYMRDQDFATLSSLSVATPYYLATSTDGWEATTTPLVTEGFSRIITFDEVYRRDSDSDIVASSSLEAKTLDADARKITVEVTWQGAPHSVRASTYLMNIFVE